MKFLQFGSENGSTSAGNTIRPYQIKLNDIFFSEPDFNAFKSFDGVSIVFRVSGKNKDFGGEGPERLQKSKGRNFLTIDLVIPECRWRSMGKVDFGDYLVCGIKECFVLLEDFLDQSGEILDKEELREKFKEGIGMFEKFYKGELQ